MLKIKDFDKEIEIYKKEQSKYSLEFKESENHVACRFNDGKIYMQCIATKIGSKKTTRRNLLASMYNVAIKELGITKFVDKVVE